MTEENGSFPAPQDPHSRHPAGKTAAHGGSVRQTVDLAPAPAKRWPLICIDGCAESAGPFKMDSPRTAGIFAESLHAGFGGLPEL
jgi:hypothetical protein